MDGHGGPVGGRAEQVDMPGREQGAGPGPPGGAAAGGPDGRVEALLAEGPLHHRDGLGAAAMVVDGRDQPRRPAHQPGLHLRGHEQRHRPAMRFDLGPGRASRYRLGCQAGGQLDQLGPRPGGRGGGWAVCDSGRGHADVLVVSTGARRVGRRTRRNGPGGRLASAGGQSRAPGPGTRAGPLQPRGEAGVAGQGGVPVRHGKAGGCRPGRRLSSRYAASSRLYRIATIP
jgi:hypothetical protein